MIPILKPLILFLAATFVHAQEIPEKSDPKPPKQQAKKRIEKPKNSPAEAYAADVPGPTHAEVSYGPHVRNTLDFWQAKSNKPSPLALIIHGGGWVDGSKERAGRFADIQALLKAGISVASINYRFIPQSADVVPPVKAPLHDSALALQFLRSKATEWNIDPTRIGAAGSSAGACTSLWLAYHDDMADPKSEDPIARQSTRLMCIAVMGAQTTLDPKQAKEWIPNSRYGGHAFGKKSFDQALKERESILPWIAEYSPYALASKDDPPVALYYVEAPNMANVQKDPTHSANYGIGLQQRCKELGIECEVIHPGTANPKYKTPTDYLIEKLALR